ncbi:MAG TPA: tRNA 4-thiouridine(8) synthase ThiI, partial [Streptosporangiaceae bacterium]|nr:tRNA 4-thiouridine(8) synthase ThiI [Streptosporangiaceae bacterium]
MSQTSLAGEAVPAGAGERYQPCVLLKLGEVVLKGGNRQQFERMLQANLRRATSDLGVPVRIWQR